MIRRLASLTPIALIACAAPDSAPRMMPPVTGAAYPVTLDARDYIVTRSALDSAPNGEVLRVYRQHAAAFGYDEGLEAKSVALAFCGEWNRGLSPEAQGYFEPTGSWAFPGGCA